MLLIDTLQRILAGGYEELAIAKMLEASSSFAHSDKVNPYPYVLLVYVYTLVTTS